MKDRIGVVYVGRQNERTRRIVWVSSMLEDQTQERDGSYVLRPRDRPNGEPDPETRNA